RLRETPGCRGFLQRHAAGVASGSVSPEGPHLDRPGLGYGMCGRDLDGLVQAAALDDVEPADRLLGLRERPVGDERLPPANAHGAGPSRRRQLVAGDPDAPGLEVVDPGKALVVRCL